MSEQGWHGFLAAEGREDWVVLRGGATAVFRVGSLSEAARLALTWPLLARPEGAGYDDCRLAVIRKKFGG